jgi:hypothetical protein
MGFLFSLIKWLILAPFKLLKFIVGDVLIFGIIGGTISVVKAVLRILFKPLVLITAVCGAAVFLFINEEKRNKVKALIGM